MMDPDGDMDPWLLDWVLLALAMLTFGGGGWLAWWGLLAPGMALMVLGAPIMTIYVALLPEHDLGG